MKAKFFVLFVLLAALTALTGLLVLAEGSERARQGQQGQCPNGCQRPRVLAFTASWCAPCQRAKPALIQIQVQGVDVQIIDIERRPDLARQYNITSVPTFLVYVSGRKPVRTNDVSVVVALTRFGH